MDLDHWDCLGRVKTCTISKFDRTDKIVCNHFREVKILSFSRINMVNVEMFGSCEMVSYSMCKKGKLKSYEA